MKRLRGRIPLPLILKEIMQKVYFAIPTHSGTLYSRCVLSLLATQRLLDIKKIGHDVQIIDSCAYLPVARNALVAMFMKDEVATDLFFLDCDVGFDASAVIKLLERPEDIVAGIYPLKRDIGGYPVQIKTEDGYPLGMDGLLEAEFLPTGFMRIKKRAIKIMENHYPELKYKSNVINVANCDVDEAYDFFNMGSIGSSEWTTEDFAFCQRWRDIGGQLWIYPDIDFTHTGNKAFEGNYHKHLIETNDHERTLDRRRA
jgi:hypothetical protein